MGGRLLAYGFVSGDACGAVCGLRGAVMADAAMLDAVLEMDVWGRERGADGRPHHGC